MSHRDAMTKQFVTLCDVARKYMPIDAAHYLDSSHDQHDQRGEDVLAQARQSPAYLEQLLNNPTSQQQ